MTLVLRSGPALEPVSVAEAKQHLRVDTSAEDTLISSLVVTSRLHVEQVLGLALITQGWSWLIDAWPDRDVLYLPMRPVQSVAAVRLYAEDESVSTLAADRYLLDGGGAPARLVRRRGPPWPRPERTANGIEVEFTAGFGSAAADVPAPLRQAVLHLVAHWYEHREPADLGSPSAQIPKTISDLLLPYRTVRL